MSYLLLRASVIRGPAVLEYVNNGVTIYLLSKEDITVQYGQQTMDVTTSEFGVVDKRVTQRTVEISLTPAGDLPTGALAALWPYASAQPGDSAFSPTGFTVSSPTLTVIPKSGQAYTFKGVILSKMPQLILSATKTVVGSLTFTALGDEGVLWSTANSLYTTAASTYAAAIAASGFTVSNIQTIPYVGTYSFTPQIGNSGVFSSRDGFTIDFNVELNPVETDIYGLFDWTIGAVVATCNCASLDVTADQINAVMPLQGTYTAAGPAAYPGQTSGLSYDRGASLISGATLTLSSSNSAVAGRTVVLNNATILQTGWAFGLATQRIPQLQFTSIRSLSAGALLPAFSVA